MEKPITPSRARELFTEYPGLTVIDNPKESEYPMPVIATGKDDVFVGRVRQDASNENGLAAWIATDNLRKGAALNALQISDSMIEMKLVV